MKRVCGLTTIRPRDRLICVIQQKLRTPAAYPDLGRDPFAGFPTFGINNLRAQIVGFVTRDRLQRRAAYPDAYSFQGGRQAHGPNTRSAGLLTAAGPPIQDVGIDHGRGHVAVPQQLRDRPDVVAVLEQVRRERVSQGAGARALGEPGVSDRGLDGALEDRLVEVMPTVSATISASIDRIILSPPASVIV